MKILVLIVSLFRFFRSSFAVFELASSIVDLVQYLHNSIYCFPPIVTENVVVIFHIEKIFTGGKQSAATNLVPQNHIKFQPIQFVTNHLLAQSCTESGLDQATKELQLNLSTTTTLGTKQWPLYMQRGGHCREV